MIDQNASFGTLSGITTLEFGKGDILVSPGIGESRTYSCVMFTNDDPHLIGTEHTRTKGQSSDDIKPQVIMFFDKVESIDVVIEVLNTAKRDLQNILNGNDI